MAAKVKGFLKALGISQMFEEEKEPEMQIGLPTDVKHVAHIGWDGPSIETPSWMKEFKEPGKFHTAPLGPPLDANDHPDNRSSNSEDADANYKNANSSLPDEQPEVTKSSRRHSSSENGSGDSISPKKTRSTRRHKESSSDGPKSSRHSRPGSGGGSDSPARDLPDIPKKTRRKKSKEDGGVSSGSSRTSKSKGTPSSSTTPMDPGQDTGYDNSILSSRNNEIDKE